MAKREFLGGFELLVLLALIRLGDDAYGVPISDAIEQSSGREVAICSAYITLDRLEAKGLVYSTSESTAGRGGRKTASASRRRVPAGASGATDDDQPGDGHAQFEGGMAHRTAACGPLVTGTVGSGPQRESLIGDMLEQFQRGRSATWYWRQTISAIVTSLVAEAWQHKGLSISVVAIGMYLPQIYIYIHPKLVVRLDNWWYPHVINSRWSWMVINPSYRLELYSLTTRITWCALLAAVAWIVTRWRPRQRGIVMTLFLVTQVSPCVSYLRIALLTWLHEPDNPMWFFEFLWFALFTFVAIPSSILLGGAASVRRGSVL
jgi:hypothetical protein